MTDLLQKVFDARREVRDEKGRFAGVPDAARFSGGGGPSLSQRKPVAATRPEKRSLVRNTAVWRVGAKIPSLPIEYTGSREPERPLGSFIRHNLKHQIVPKSDVSSHFNLVGRLNAVIRNEQANTVLMGHARGHIPKGTARHTVNRAYAHASLLAMHDYGVADYNFQMDDHLKKEMEPLKPFMQYARRRVVNSMRNTAKGEWKPYRDAFGQDAGGGRKRVRPNKELVKGFFRSTAGRAMSAVDRAVRPPNPSYVHQGATAVGGATARGVKRVVRAPIATARAAVAEGARTGAGFFEGAAKEFGAGPRVARAAARVGAVSGGSKLAVVGAMVAHKPIHALYAHAIGGPSTSSNPKQPGALGKAFDEARQKRDSRGRFSGADEVVGAAAGAGTAGTAIGVAHIAQVKPVIAHQRLRAQRAYRRRLIAAKAAGEEVVWRGAPVADPAPKPRTEKQKGYGAVFVARDKDTARYYGKAVGRFAVDKKAKFLELHDPAAKLIAPPDAKLPTTKDGRASVYDHGLWHLSDAQHKTIRALGYAGVEAPQIERHDALAISDLGALRHIGTGFRDGAASTVVRAARIVSRRSLPIAAGGAVAGVAAAEIGRLTSSSP